MIDSVYAGGGVVGPDAYDSIVTAVGSSPHAMYGQAREPERIQNTLEPDERRENNREIERQNHSVQHEPRTA